MASGSVITPPKTDVMSGPVTERQLILSTNQLDRNRRWLLLFDHDGATAICEKPVFLEETNDPLPIRRILKSGKDQWLVEILSVGDKEIVEKADEEWTTSARNLAIVNEMIQRNVQGEHIHGGLLDVTVPAVRQEIRPDAEKITEEGTQKQNQTKGKGPGKPKGCSGGNRKRKANEGTQADTVGNTRKTPKTAAATSTTTEATGKTRKTSNTTPEKAATSTTTEATGKTRKTSKTTPEKAATSTTTEATGKITIEGSFPSGGKDNEDVADEVARDYFDFIPPKDKSVVKAKFCFVYVT